MKPEVQFFAFNVRILSISGLWYELSESSDGKWYLMLIYNCCCFLYALVLFTLAELMSLKDSSQDIFDLVKNLNMSLSFVLTFCKVCVWFYNRKQIVKIMRTLQSTSKRFKDSDGMIFKDQNVSLRLARTFFLLACTVPTSACVLSVWDVKEKGPYKLPYNSFVPFDYHQSKFWYCLAVFYQCLALLICGVMTVGFDSLFFSLANFLSTHFYLLSEAFENIKFKSSQEQMEKQLKSHIKHLQLILKIHSRLEDIFNVLILLQTIISLIVFCTCLFIISILPPQESIFGNEMAYMLAIENQLVMYCFAGNKLTTRAAEIPFALYSSDWLQAGKRFKTNLLFTMMQMNKSVHLTAGKFTPLTLGTFVTIGRGSYSLLAVLKKRNAANNLH